jgi:molybdopterin synthase catalytic subunit
MQSSSAIWKHNLVSSEASVGHLTQDSSDAGLVDTHEAKRAAPPDRPLTQIAEEAARRWSLAECLIIHRYGRMEPGAKIMMVATAARHRADAFAAADFLMDYLKSRAPFWKKEFSGEGAEWVAAKDADEAALGRWG